MDESIRPMTLDGLNIGQQARVSDIQTVGSMRCRLQDIGFIPGARVECVQRSPAGDPTAYLIRGAVIALRNRDCRGILIEQTE